LYIEQHMNSSLGKWVPGTVAACAIVGVMIWLLVDFPVARFQTTTSTASIKQDPTSIDPPACPVGQPILPASKNEPLFEEAMRHYRKGEYGPASFSLRQATARQPANPEIRFFLGVCYLLTADTRAGIQELKVAEGLESSPYVERIHFYLAKAFLKQQDTTNAMRQLNALVDKGGNLAEPARKLKVDLANLQ
jgi:thioredoxin-like negative regulator of GroEL